MYIKNHICFSYTVEVRSKVISAKNITEMWSKAAHISFWSASRIPEHPPLIAPGNFLVDDTNNIHVYWKELEEFHQNGAGFTYQVKCTSDAGHETPWLNSTSFMKKYSSIKENVDKDIEFEIRSVNKEGPSRLATTFKVPSRASRCAPPTEIRSILHNQNVPDRRYVFSWRPPATSGHTITSYTVFWCIHNGIDPSSPCNVG